MLSKDAVAKQGLRSLTLKEIPSKDGTEPENTNSAHNFPFAGNVSKFTLQKVRFVFVFFYFKFELIQAQVCLFTLYY